MALFFNAYIFEKTKDELAMPESGFSSDRKAALLDFIFIKLFAHKPSKPPTARDRNAGLAQTKTEAG